MKMKQYVLVDKMRGKLEPLRVGRNIIGRGALPAIDCVGFASLESPRSAVSRTHAIIELAENGDAWLSDCNSTNGTFVAVNAGSGTRLEPERFYQLRPGTRVIFGDVELLFDDGSKSQDDEGHRRSTMLLQTSPSLSTTCGTPPGRACSEHPHWNDGARFDDSGGDAAAAAAAVSAERPRPSASDNAVKAAFNDYETGESPGEPDESSSYPTTEITARKKRNRSKGSETSQRAVKSAKTASRTTIAAPSAHAAAAAAQRLEQVCFSGMDDEARARVQKLTKQLGLKVTNNILDADALIVSSPATRTPKFLIAVGRGIPVVTEDFLNSGEASQLVKFVPPLIHGPHTYTAAALRDVIFRTSKTPILQGMSFNLSGIPSRARGVAREIISGCGGDIPRRQSKDSVALTEASLDELYDAVLRGVPP